MKRLIRKSMMDLEIFKSTVEQLGDEGRTVLKALEDYKFKLEQSGRILQNDPELAQKLVQKRKTLDAAAGQIYSVVFDIENIDITQMYENQQFLINNPGMGGAPADGQVPPMGGQPIQPPNEAPNPNGEEENSAPIGGGGDMGDNEPVNEEKDTETEDGGEEGIDEEGADEVPDNLNEEEPQK